MHQGLGHVLGCLFSRSFSSMDAAPPARSAPEDAPLRAPVPPAFAGASPREYLQAVVRVVNKYSFLHLGRVVFFYAHSADYWERIPPAWADELLRIPLPLLLSVPSLVVRPPGEPLPEELRTFEHTAAFIHDVREHALLRAPSAVRFGKDPREVHSPETAAAAAAAQSPPPHVPGSHVVPSPELLTPQQTLLLRKELTRKMSPKKIHECVRAAEAIAALSAHHGCRNVVDIGSGAGYLSHLLAYGSNLSVLGLEGSEAIAELARDRARHIQRWQHKVGGRRGRKQSPVTTRRCQQPQSEEAGDSTGGNLFSAPAPSAEDLGPNDGHGNLGSDAVGAAAVTSSSVSPLSASSGRSGGEDGEEPLRSEVVTCFIRSKTDILRACSRERRPSLLVGLHVCGDLTSLVLDAFVSSGPHQGEGKEECASDAHETGSVLPRDSPSHASPPIPQSFAGLCVFGCCYHKVTEDRFPLSKLGASEGLKSAFGRDSLRSACFSPQRWDSPEAMGLFRMHHFRAMLQIILMKFFPDAPSADCETSGVGHIPQSRAGDFLQYTRAALSKLGLPNVAEPGGPPLEYVSQLDAAHGDDKLRRVCIFWTLRAALGPLLESAILLDRYMFLAEHGHQPFLQALFDPEESPRNVAIMV